MDKILHTKWGRARLNNYGYYRITSYKEGNNGKLLHRLIYEDFYGEIPEGYNIHHKNGNKKDNCILNLALVEHGEHSRQHNHIIKQGKSRPSNSTGYYRVHKENGATYKQGFTYVYEVDSSRLDGDKRTKKKIKSVDLKKLEEKVKAQGYEWRKIR